MPCLFKIMPSTFGVTVAILVTLGSYLYYKHVTNQDERIAQVLNGLKTLESGTPLEGSPKVACGFESTIDYFVDFLKLFEAMNFEPPDEARPHDFLKSEQELLETFAFFFNHSAASS